jgi:hypothetical protein
MLGLSGVSGRRFQISNSTGGTVMYIEDTGQMYTAKTFECVGAASLGSLECWGNITSREGIYIYAGKTLSANGPINAYSGLNVVTGATTLQNTTIAGDLKLQSSDANIFGFIKVDTGNNMLFNITNGAEFNYWFSGVKVFSLNYTNATFTTAISCPTLAVSGATTINGTLQLGSSSSSLINSGYYLQNVSNSNTLSLFAGGGIFNVCNSNNGGTQMFRIDGSTSSKNIFTFYNYAGATNIFKIDESQSLVTSAYQIKSPSFNATSDYRIKENVHKIPSYPNIDNLNPVTYKNTITGKQDMGFIAHELQEHFPFLVSGEKDGPENQSVNYIGLIALLTKEIQDLKKEIKEIKNGK